MVNGNPETIQQELPSAEADTPIVDLNAPAETEVEAPASSPSEVVEEVSTETQSPDTSELADLQGQLQTMTQERAQLQQQAQAAYAQAAEAQAKAKLDQGVREYEQSLVEQGYDNEQARMQAQQARTAYEAQQRAQSDVTSAAANEKLRTDTAIEAVKTHDLGVDDIDELRQFDSRDTMFAHANRLQKNRELEARIVELEKGTVTPTKFDNGKGQGATGGHNDDDIIASADSDAPFNAREVEAAMRRKFGNI